MTKRKQAPPSEPAPVGWAWSADNLSAWSFDDLPDWEPIELQPWEPFDWPGWAWPDDLPGWSADILESFTWSADDLLTWPGWADQDERRPPANPGHQNGQQCP